ncbi:MAG: hypothetical protein KJO82_15295, partial [Gammaproteobacteria bacterium]|nr:hypothetical protein [Gammaproteobacteria bacterium]
MTELADSAFYVGNFLVDPEASTISGATGASTVKRARMRVLAALAVRPGASIPLDELAEAAGVGRDSISVDLQSLREILGDNGQNPRFLLIDDSNATLIAPVRSLGERQIAQLASDREVETGISFFQQLQRRKVIRVGAAYILLAWVAIQVADVVLPALGLPGWTITLTIGLAMAGFPIALVIA